LDVWIPNDSLTKAPVKEAKGTEGDKKKKVEDVKEALV
jgi:hypothetical protein